jgi:Bacterial Ig-like domain (group 2)
MRIRFLVSLCLAAAGLLSACDKEDVVSPGGNDAQVVALAVSPTGSFLQVGQSRPLAVEARDANGELVSSVTVQWESDAPAVATVSASGVVLGVTPGSARIKASVGTISQTVDVGVTATAPGVSQWQITRPGFSDATLLGVWDDGAGITWAVGQQGAIMRSRNGAAWEIVPSGVSVTQTSFGPPVQMMSGLLAKPEPSCATRARGLCR